MTKLEFLSALRDRLVDLPEEDLKRSLEYYSESMDDRMEDGLTEEEAVEAMGPIDEIVAQILMGAPLPKPGMPLPKQSMGKEEKENGKEKEKEKEKAKTNRTSGMNRTLGAGVIALLILGFPLWFPLLIAFVSVVFSLYVVFWSMIVVLYAVDVTFAAGAVAGIFGSAAALLTGGISQGLFTLGGGLVCAGLTILWFFVCTLAAKGLVWFSKTLILAIRACFGKRKGKEYAR